MAIMFALALGGGAGYATHELGGDEASVILTGGVLFVGALLVGLVSTNPVKNGGDNAMPAVLRIAGMALFAGVALYFFPPLFKLWGGIVFLIDLTWAVIDVGMTTKFFKLSGSAIDVRDGSAIAANLNRLLGVQIGLLVLLGGIHIFG